MASNINPANLDINFPIAGQDNDTQTFRDNFSATRNNFLTAKTEISALQTTIATAPTIKSVPVSASADGTAGQIAYGLAYYNPTVANTYATGNLVKVGNIVNLQAGQKFILDNNLGGLTSGTTYYIKHVYSSGNITLANAQLTSINETVTLTTDTANVTMTANISSYYMYVCVNTNVWQRTPLATWQ
jgi:hypothetical protein